MKTHYFFITAVLLLLNSHFCIIGADKNIQDLLFDNQWKFILNDNKEFAFSKFDDSNWQNIDLPHDWSIAGKPEKQNPMGGAGGYFPSGIGWYRKTFEVPDNWKNKVISIYFEGVYMDAEVYVNGKLAGKHPYGFTSFSFDVSSLLKTGQTNNISIRVDNSKQINCRWYSGSGIYRHVRLLIKNPLHIPQWGVNINTQKIENNRSTLSVKTTIVNKGNKTQEFNIQTKIKGKKGISHKSTAYQLGAGAIKTIEQIIYIENAKLWSTEKPNLYQVCVEVQQGRKVLDKVVTETGIRTIEYSAEKGFLLNGKTIKLNGGCVHHDHGCLGAASFDRAEERKVELLKSAGFNAVRTSHNPPAEAFLNACDKLGLLVIDEVFDGWRTEKNKFDYAHIFDQWSENDLLSMINRDKNHPSVIMWSIGNEIIERKSADAVNTARRLTKIAHKVDSSRPVTSAMTSWNEGWEIFDPLMAEHDICGYNYMLHESVKDHERVPSRVIVQTESYPREAFKNWIAVQQQDYVIGDFVWTAQDYLGESGIGRWYYPGEPKGEHWERDFFPWHGAYCGDIDLMGNRKPISHYRDMLWNSKEKLYLAVREPNPNEGKITETMWSVWPTWESWTWSGYEGKTIEAEVYSKYPEIKLYLNDSLVSHRMTNLSCEFKATIPVKYASGILKVVGIENDQIMESKILQTSGNATQITAQSDRNIIQANGQDLVFVNIELRDKNGVINPNADNRLNFKIEGPGTIIGVDNADLKDTESYQSENRKAWKGKAMVVIRSTQIKGTIQLKITSDGLTQKTIKINSK